MAVNFSCPECDKILKSSKPISPGKKVKCPGCGALFFPQPEEEEVPEYMPRPKRRHLDEEDEKKRPTQRPDPEEDQDEEDEGSPPKRRSRREDEEDDRARKKKKKKPKSKLPLILSLSGGGAALLILVLTAFLWPGFLRSSGPKGGPGPKGGGSPDTAKIWEPDAALLNQLSPPNQVGTYEIRLPKGYSKLDPPGLPGSKMYVWAGDQRPDETAPQVTIAIATPPPGDATTLEEFLVSMIGGLKKRRTNWSQTNSEAGQINGMRFLVVRWNGKEKVKGAKMQGFIYVAKDGPNFIQISSQDIEPHHEQTLKIAEAAALTFKKK